MNYYVKCERLDHFGRGITYINGKIIFVKNLLPGEVANIKITKSKKNYDIGEIISLEKVSKDRVESKCPYINCGCALKHLTYEKQLEFKEEKLKNILKKYTDLEGIVKPIIEATNINGYRNKITLKVGSKVGYFENESNKLIEINRCELVSEKINKIISVLNKLDLSKVKEIVIKEFDQIMIIVKGTIDLATLKALADSIYMNDKLVHGKPFITTKINNLIFQISKDSFFQVNKEMTEKLYEKVISYCDKNQKLLDLYCGTGTMSLLLSDHFKEVIGIEINKEAVLCANKNKEINNIQNVNFICGDVSKEIENLKADIIIVDPPRSGLTKEGINDILKTNPNKIIYVSCDPMTLARDLNYFKENYNIKEVTPVDMFPNTYHVECVCLLEKM